MWGALVPTQPAFTAPKALTCLVGADFCLVFALQVFVISPHTYACQKGGALLQTDMEPEN